ncbi:MAG: TonB-dependent receptor, partial [Bacteroidetes bacterium]|nr:TonB-dependent receptor [Bacteroidota bacterium]
TIPDYQFGGKQIASFSEASYSIEKPNADWIFGANLFTDQFTENHPDTALLRDYQNTTLGVFTQNTWDIMSNLALESGLRADYHSLYGAFLLPRASMLFRFNQKFSGRLGGGMGYKLPTIFTEESEALTFQNILPIDRANIKAERSLGVNFDLNYETLIGDKMTFSINQFFFFTRLNQSLVLEQNPSTQKYFFSNADGTVDSRGFETNIKLTYGYFKLFFQYVFVDVQLNYNNINNQKPLTPRHNAGAVLVYEQHEKWRIGLESYYTGQQFRSDYTPTRDYWVVGFMALRQFERFSLFINFENFIDTRQSRFQDIVIPPLSNPSFAEIWAPTDGFVVNGGFILKILGSEDEHGDH